MTIEHQLTFFFLLSFSQEQMFVHILWPTHINISCLYVMSTGKKNKMNTVHKSSTWHWQCRSTYLGCNLWGASRLRGAPWRRSARGSSCPWVCPGRWRPGCWCCSGRCACGRSPWAAWRGTPARSAGPGRRRRPRTPTRADPGSSTPTRRCCRPWARRWWRKERTMKEGTNNIILPLLSTFHYNMQLTGNTCSERPCGKRMAKSLAK